MKKIAICGKQNTGKNTLANLLGNLIAYKSKRDTEIIAFADPIKEMIMKMFPLAESKCLWGPSGWRSNIIPNATDKKGNPLTYRQALIDIGSLGRQYNPDTWIYTFDARTQNLQKELLVCPDVRFVNEYEYLKKNDFLVVKIVRDTISKSTDATETAQDQIKDEQFDYILNNNSTINDFEKQAAIIANLLK